MVYTHVADLDVKSGYPNIEIILNISKETTYMEMCAVKGVSNTVQRNAGINLNAGPVNAYEFCRDMFNAPSFDQLLEEFENEAA